MSNEKDQVLSPMAQELLSLLSPLPKLSGLHEFFQGRDHSKTDRKLTVWIGDGNKSVVSFEFGPKFLRDMASLDVIVVRSSQGDFGREGVTKYKL